MAERGYKTDKTLCAMLTFANDANLRLTFVSSSSVGRYRALVNMWTKYGQEPHMSGVALQHQTYTVTGESNTNISGLVRWVLAYSSRGG